MFLIKIIQFRSTAGRDKLIDAVHKFEHIVHEVDLMRDLSVRITEQDHAAADILKFHIPDDGGH